jgi:hypothetical protein
VDRPAAEPPPRSGREPAQCKAGLPSELAAQRKAAPE